MTKEDLKTGMLVEIENGNLYIVLKDTDVFGHRDVLSSINFKHGGYLALDDYSETLEFFTTNFGWGEFTIKTVYDYETYPGTLFRDLIALGKPRADRMTLLWKREPRKRMTLKEVEEELGYKVEIIQEEVARG